jgi:two-component system, NtrC family, sensor kinase
MHSGLASPSSQRPPPAEASGPEVRQLSTGGAVRLLHVLLVASVIVPVAAFVVAAWFDWQELRGQAVQQSGRTVQILREHALKVFEAHEFVIDQIDERVRGMSWSEIRESREVQSYIERLAQRQNLVTSIVLVAPDGKVASVSNAFPPPALDMSDRAYFIAAKAGERGTHIGQPVAGRVTGNRVMVVSRAKTAPAGQFDGVIAVAISLDRFAEFYRGITSLEENSVTLGRTDGTVLAREPPITTGASKLTPASGFMRAIQTNGTNYRTIGELDGIERFHSIVPVGNYPVYVSYGLSLAGLTSMWLIDLMMFGFFAATASVGLFLVSLLALRRVRSEQRLVEQWQDEVQRREQAEQTLRQTQKMEALGQLTGGVAHDFNNLLMVIGGNIELLKKKAAGVGADRQISAIEHAARNGEALTKKLLAFSRRRIVKAKSIELDPFLSKLVDLLKPSLPAEVDIVADAPPGIWPVEADADDLELSLVNVVLNARDAMSGGGLVTIAARNQALRADDPRTDNLAGDFVVLSVHDTGSGIAPEHMSRVFEPFFTTKEIGRGTGLGLSQVYGFAKQSGGTVTIGSAPGRGTTVTLYLPRSQRAALDAAPAASALTSPATVLLVEDNKDVAEATVAMLEILGCTVRHVAAAEPALDILTKGERFDLVLSDIVMPGGFDGVQLARIVRDRFPSMAVLLTTGYSNAAQKAANEMFPILIKPYQIEALQQAIGEAVSRSNGGRPAAAASA